MDIGNQQRVIIVEPDREIADQFPAPPTEQATFAEPESAAMWPLPLDLDPEPVS